MRVLLAGPGMGVGGAERVIVGLAHGLAARGHEVIVSGPAGPLDAELVVERLLLPESGRSAAGAARSALHLARAIRERRPTLIHAHNVKATAVAGVAARLARGPRRPPVIATFHGVLPAEYPAAARLLRTADRVACVSEDLRRGLERAGGARLLVVHNAAPAPVSAEVSGLPDGLLVVAVGRLVEQKNHARLLLAARRVRERGVPASFLVLGDGPLRSGLTALAAELGLSGVVRFAGARSDAPAIMARADLVAFSSDWEGLSIAALESLAAGTPVVSTPVEGMRELLETGAGAMTASMDPDVLGDLIADLLADPARRAAMGAEGRRLVAARFSPAAMLDAYERLYREALLSRRG